MKITESKLRRIIRKAIVENLDIEQSAEEKLGQLMSDPVNDPENWLAGFELGMSTGVIEVLENKYEGEYKVKMPYTISQYCYTHFRTIENRRDFGREHPFRIFPTAQYITVIIAAEQKMQ